MDEDKFGGEGCVGEIAFVKMMEQQIFECIRHLQCEVVRIIKKLYLAGHRLSL